MKRSIISLFVSVIIILIAQSCMNLYDQPAVDNDEKKDTTKNSIQTLSESMDDFNEKMETVDNMEQQLLDLEKMANSGEISEDEMKKITEKYYGKNDMF